MGFLAVAGFLTGCEFPADQLISKRASKELSNPLTVNVMRITRESAAVETAMFFGNLKPNRQNALVFGKGGRIKSILKQVGEQAIAGDKLAELEQSQLVNQQTEIEQRILQARQALQPDAANRTAILEEIQRLEAQLEAINSEISNGFILAPFDCVVAQKFVDQGGLISPQAPVLQIFENKSPTVETNLPRRIADQFAVDQLLWVSIGEQVVQAQVKTRSPIETSIGSQTVSLQITTDLAQNSWGVGQLVEIRFTLPTENSGYWLPISALNREPNGLWSALLIAERPDQGGSGLSESVSNNDDTTVVRKLLEIIQLENGWALADGPLDEGERVVVNGTHRIVPGQSVATTDITDQLRKPGSGASE